MIAELTNHVWQSTAALALTLATVGVMAVAATPEFEVVSIKSCEAFRKSKVQNFSPGTFHAGCTSVQRLIQQAYGLFANGHMNPLSSVTVTGDPAWARPQTRATMNGPMLQALLEGGFKLRVHHETREVPIYHLTVADGGYKLRPFQGSCVPWDYDHPNPGPQQCATSRLTSSGAELTAWAIPDLLYFFVVSLERPDIGNRALGAPALSDPAVPATDPSLVSAVRIAVKKLGLNLEPATGRGEFIVVDHVERPSGT